MISSDSSISFERLIPSAHPISPERLALVLDVDNLSDAKALVKKLGAYYGVLKIGLTLWSAEGPKAVDSLKSKDHQIFLDLKLHDIPNQVETAAEVLSELGVEYVTLHAAGGNEMLSRGVRGLAKKHQSKALAITVLTSQTEINEEIFTERVELAQQAGCFGIVCSAHEVAVAKKAFPDIFCAVPGIRLEGADAHDQARVATLSEADALGADLFVIGRTVTASSDPIKATKQLLGI